MMNTNLMLSLSNNSAFSNIYTNKFSFSYLKISCSSVTTARTGRDRLTQYIKPRASFHNTLHPQIGTLDY